MDKKTLKTKRPGKKRAIVQIDINGKEIATFASIKEAGQLMGIDTFEIISVARGSKRGFYWKYADGKINVPKPKPEPVYCQKCSSTGELFRVCLDCFQKIPQ